MDKDKREHHPSYGLVGFHRISSAGPRRLFGSRLTTHPTTILLRIHHASVEHDLARDWIYADGRLPIVEVELSPAQFSELLTTMNVGDGVPCTIRNCREGKSLRVDDVPQEHTVEQEKIYKSFRGELNERLETIKDRQKRLRELLDKKGKLNKAERAEIYNLSDGLFRFFWDHAPFILKSFEESAEKVASEAKASVDSFVTTAVTKLGVKSLKDRLLGSDNVLDAIASPREKLIDYPTGDKNNG